MNFKPLSLCEKKYIRTESKNDSISVYMEMEYTTTINTGSNSLDALFACREADLDDFLLSNSKNQITFWSVQIYSITIYGFM